MAETAQPTNPSVFQELEAVLNDPEPMCLTLVRVAATGLSTKSWTDLPDGGLPEPTAAVRCVGARLSGQLRRYDLMGRLGDEGFMVVFKTLADADVMEARIGRLYEELTRPYEIDGCEVSLPITIGAAVRRPAEEAESLMRRADEALTQADRSQGSNLVLA